MGWMCVVMAVIARFLYALLKRVEALESRDVEYEEFYAKHPGGEE